MSSEIINLQTYYVKKADIINNLTTDDTTKPLSAKQGKALKTLIDEKAVTLTKLATATSGYIATYEIKQGGTSLGKIDIPKDYLVKSGSVKSVTTANSPVNGYAVGDKYIDFVINTKTSDGTDEHLYVNTKDFIDDATQSRSGLMSKNDKTKLDGIATGANAYTHPSGTAKTGNPTANQTPAFGSTFTVTQFTSNSTGHISGATDRTVKIPNNLGNGTTAGLSTNDYTTTEKSKLAGVATGATKNTVENSLSSDSTTNALSAAKGKDLQTQISNIVSGATATDHNHDSRYYTESEIDTKLNSKVNTSDARLTDARTPKFNLITASASNIVDLNTYKTGGFYYTNSDVNYAPYIIHCPWSNGTATPYTGNKSFFLLVETWGTTSTYVKQTLTYYNGNNTYARTCNNGTWTNWKEFNTNNNDYLRFATRVISGEAIAINNIICGSTDSKYYQLKSGKIIDIKYPILFNTSAITSGSYTDNVYSSHTGVPLTNNVSGKTVTSQKQVYIEGTSFDGRQFVVSDRVFVSDDQISNTTDLGKYYIYIGVSYSTTNIRFNSFHQTVYVETRNGLVPVGDNTHNPHILFKSDAGTAGYFKFLTIRTTGTYHDQTIEFDTTHRGNKPKTVVSFNFNTYEKTSGSKQYYTNIQAFYYHGHPTPVYYIQTNDGVQDATFDFYIRRETWDEIGVSDLRSSIDNYNGMTVTWHNDFVTTLPTGTTQATLNPYYAQVGHTHNYLPTNANGTTTGTLTAAGFKVGTQTGFLKADGTVDTNTYNNYTHPTSYGAKTGVPTTNATLTHGGTFTVTQPVTDAMGHVTALNTRTYTLPSDNNTTYSAATGTSAVGLVKISDNYTSSAGAASASVAASSKAVYDTYNTFAGTGTTKNAHTHTKSQITDFPTSMTPTSHTHGSITNDGKIGSTANLPVITGTNGALTTGSFGTGANTFCQGNDSRLSNARTPTAHQADTNAYGAATTAKWGHTKLNSATNSTDETTAATPKAVKAAYDKGNHTHPYISTTAGSVGASNLASNAVEEAKIKDGAVTTNKLGASAVTSAKIADGTIVNADISSSAAIATSKISGLDTALNGKLSTATYTNGTLTIQ